MEIVDKFDNKRLPLNKTSERYADIKGEYAQVVHVWIINSKGELFIQKRSAEKRAFPNLWSITGGGVDEGENTLQAALRECNEELGIKIEPDEIELVMSYKREYDFLDIWLVKKDFKLEDVVMQEEEVSDVKWVTVEEFVEMMRSNKIAPSIEIYFELLMRIIEN